MSTPLIPREEPRSARAARGSGAGLRHIRCFTGRRVIAQVRGGSLLLHRYDDGLPDAIEQTLTLAGGGVTGCALRSRPCSSLDLYYCQGRGVYHLLSRNEGATWTAPAPVNAGGAALSGYSLVEMSHDGSRGLLALWNGSWHLCAGSVTDDGAGWEWSAPQVMTGAAARQWGTLRRLPDGAWLFSWTDSDGAPRVSSCRCLDRRGSGTWEPLAAAPGYTQAALHYGQSLAGVPVYHAGGRWEVLAGSFGEGAGLTLAGPGVIGAADPAMGGLLLRCDGAWEFALVPQGGGNPVVRRCKALRSSGAGAWE